ncbi:hypothetical protein FSARC_4808 [Fusarium sarcochroum]|uniref:Uncharacterized protein n=1 Tax=Fusarium sarcochroum TaxID=1208366 RepID=A0A8H4U1B1_9HYPO|nr:hypothetical protein FSARC_4808 [Fusarium sarcochroum]
MAQPHAATSILELLTHPNPSVSHQKPKSTTNTRGRGWYCPVQIIKWDEFEDPKILEKMYGGDLLREAVCEGRNLGYYPSMHPQTDCNICNEDDTRDLIQKWNKTIVTAALDPIQQQFHPVIWRKGDPPKGKEEHQLPKRRQAKERDQPVRKSTSKGRQPKKQSLSRLKPDSGSVLWIPPSIKADSITYRGERFPKEYKPSSKWRSESLSENELLDDSGELFDFKTNNNHVWPIKQAYTYCIQHMCRYGCILTCKEAFIFRVGPRKDKSFNGPQDADSLKHELINDGLMEYISIPWDNHNRNHKDRLDTWTINLALWFVHILAGNNFEARWTYDSLIDEPLTVSTPLEDRARPIVTPPISEADQVERQEDDLEENVSVASQESDATNPFISPTTKRKRHLDEDEEEGIYLSFSKRQLV